MYTYKYIIYTYHISSMASPRILSLLCAWDIAPIFVDFAMTYRPGGRGREGVYEGLGVYISEYKYSIVYKIAV